MRGTVVATIIALTGCAPEQPETTEPSTAVYIGGDHGMEARFANGEVARGWEEYETEVMRQAKRGGEFERVPLTVEDHPNPPPLPPGVQALRWEFGKFSVVFEPDLGYTGHCIRRHILHLKLAVENKKVPAPLIELHFVAWLEHNRPCVGVLNSSFIGNGWCQKLCWTATREDIGRMMTDGLVAAGVAGTTAAILSRVLVPIAIGALAL